MNFVQTYQARINEKIKQFFADREKKYPKIHRLHEAMYYAVMPEGKRIRPLLVYATGLCFDADPLKMDSAAMAIEFMHSYSLIHDDLPSMDNDDIRRGKPSCHKAFGEATAILAGDALQCLAFEVLAWENEARLLSVLAHASGSSGMVGGQQLDLDAKKKLVSYKEQEEINHLKTGALFSVSVELGALSAGCKDEALLSTCREWGRLLGLIFQWNDDLDDEEIEEYAVKAAIVSDVTALLSQAKSLLDQIEGNTNFLRLLMDQVKPSR